MLEGQAKACFFVKKIIFLKNHIDKRIILIYNHYQIKQFIKF